MTRMALLCVSKGIDYDVAFALYPDELMAYCVIFGELDGGRFDWEASKWLERE
jgi:hypothetical protein